MVVQRLQRHDELGRRAIRVGDDVLLGEERDRVRVHFRHDQRHFGVVAPGRRVVDDDAALLADLRRILERNSAAGRHQADIGIGKIVVFEVPDLEGLVAKGNFRALGAGGSKRDHFIRGKAAFGKDVQHLPADIAGGACDCNLETHDLSSLSVSPRRVEGEPRALPRRFRSPALPGRERRARDVRRFSSSFWPWF
ncbi:hypothetical protein D9M70_480500 [compost metagenome]